MGLDDFLKKGLYYSWQFVKEENDTWSDSFDDDYVDEGDVFVSNYNIRLWVPSFQMLFGLIIVTFMTKRKTKWPDCARGYFGLAVPTNFLEGRKRRKPYVAAFSLVAMAVISALQTMDNELGGLPAAVKIIIKLFLVSAIGCYYFPLFACIHLATLPACIVGLIYHVMLIAIIIIDEIPAPGLPTKALVKELLLSSIVLCTAGSFLIYWFTKRIYGHYKKSIIIEDIPRNQAKYVRSLFLPKEKYLLLQEIGTLDETSGHKIVQLFRKYVYHDIPGFRYSLTILVSCTIGFIVITQLSIMTFYGFIKNVVEVLHLLDNFKVFKKTTIPNIVEIIVQHFTKTIPDSKNSTTPVTDISLYDFLYYQSLIILVQSIFAGLIAYILSIISMCRLLTMYRKNVMGLSKRKENQTILDLSKDVSNISLVRSAIQYGGYQVAYLIAGFSIQLFSLNVILFILLEVIVLPIQFAFWSFVAKVFEIISPIIIALILIHLTQYLLIKYFFLEDKGETMALNNRRGFFIMSYFVFFYNIFTGVFSCAKRILKGAIIGILLVPRLDTSVFPRIFEKNDSGFKAYSCLLHLEALQSNPIVRIFVIFLLRKLQNIEKISSSHTEENGVLLEVKLTKKRKVARNRWFIAYTLIRNPTIICFRGQLNILSILEAYGKPIPIVEGKSIANEVETNDRKRTQSPDLI